MQYGQGSPRVRSSDCFTRLRVMATSPKSLNWRTFDGARSLRSASSSACITFWRFLRSSMSMKSMTMMPPRSRRRIWRTISLIASTLVLTMVSSRRCGLADVLAGVDVDGDQRFGLVDDDVAAALQPDFRLAAPC